ncbi:Replication-associated protein [Smittium mucronatum]|uniref:Replication-associated protein n=1 Tax=Smittium mucronatum TaxID=133383 RepID=A0A1R0H818_9FUNG|nr:Replication-associated protein [Smittium mucronatum]
MPPKKSRKREVINDSSESGGKKPTRRSERINNSPKSLFDKKLDLYPINVGSTSRSSKRSLLINNSSELIPKIESFEGGYVKYETTIKQEFSNNHAYPQGLKHPVVKIESDSESESNIERGKNIKKEVVSNLDGRCNDIKKVGSNAVTSEMVRIEDTETAPILETKPVNCYQMAVTERGIESPEISVSQLPGPYSQGIPSNSVFNVRPLVHSRNKTVIKRDAIVINNKNLVLIYLDCPVAKETARQELLGKSVLRNKIDAYMIGRNLSENGNYQLDVYLKLKTRIISLSLSSLDIFGYHATVKKVKSEKPAVYQCIRGQDFLTDFSIGEIQVTERDFLKMVSQYKSIEEALSIAKYCSSICDQMFLNYQSALNKLNRAISLRRDTNNNPEYKFFPPPEIDGWDPKKKALLLVGSDRTGKTSYAKSLFDRPYVISYLFELRELDLNYHECIIFDIFEMNDLSKSAQLNLINVPSMRRIKIPYRYVTLPPSFPIIFVSPFVDFTKFDEVASRIYTINVVSDLRDKRGGNYPSEINLLPAPKEFFVPF